MGRHRIRGTGSRRRRTVEIWGGMFLATAALLATGIAWAQTATWTGTVQVTVDGATTGGAKADGTAAGVPEDSATAAADRPAPAGPPTATPSVERTPTPAHPPSGTAAAPGGQPGNGTGSPTSGTTGTAGTGPEPTGLEPTGPTTPAGRAVSGPVESRGRDGTE